MVSGVSVAGFARLHQPRIVPGDIGVSQANSPIAPQIGLNRMRSLIAGQSTGLNGNGFITQVCFCKPPLGGTLWPAGTISGILYAKDLPGLRFLPFLYAKGSSPKLPEPLHLLSTYLTS